MTPAAREIGFDLRVCATRSVGGFIREAAAAIDGPGGEVRWERLEESVKSLEEERKKIEAFKRELPLCMNLITDVIDELKKELKGWKGQRFPCVFEKITPEKNKFEEMSKLEKDCMEKSNWMSSAQLWSDNSNNNNKQNTKVESKIIEERIGKTPDRRSETQNLFSNSKTHKVSEFLPLGLPLMAHVIKENEKSVPSVPSVHELSLGSHATKLIDRTEDQSASSLSFQYMSRAPVSEPVVATMQLSLQSQQQNSRKTRRCWSQDLHRRFLMALHELGGAQVATPKQIREVMKVDGLTNDEVKSHLQKYRLHTRKMPNALVSVNHPIVMMGGIWAPSEKCTSLSPDQSVSGSPESPLQLAVSDRAISTTGGDSCDDEDGKSEGYSWK